MPFRLAANENVDIGLINALKRKFPGLDLVRVVDVGLASTPDPEILEWAAAENRILLTHDVATMKDYAWDRVRAGVSMPGVFVVLATATIGPIVQVLELILECSDPEDWRKQVSFVPIT